MSALTRSPDLESGSSDRIDTTGCHLFPGCVAISFAVIFSLFTVSINTKGNTITALSTAGIAFGILTLVGSAGAVRIPTDLDLCLTSV